MTVQIESISKKEKDNGEFHFIFTLSLLFPALGVITTKGWRYYPSTGGVQAPSVKRGEFWTPTVWVGGTIYDTIVDFTQNYFVSLGLCEEPWELSGKKKGRKKK